MKNAKDAIDDNNIDHNADDGHRGADVFFFEFVVFEISNSVFRHIYAILWLIRD